MNDLHHFSHFFITIHVGFYITGKSLILTQSHRFIIWKRKKKKFAFSELCLDKKKRIHRNSYENDTYHWILYLDSFSFWQIPYAQQCRLAFSELAVYHNLRHAPPLSAVFLWIHTVIHIWNEIYFLQKSFWPFCYLWWLNYAVI